MKKTKVLIPGLALIAFSTVSSIAGSVAWFTANRLATVNAGTYAVVKTTANLECTATNVLGTSVSDNTITVAGVLTDASFNHKTGMIYQPNSSGTDFHETNPEVAYNDADLATKLNRGTTSDSKTIYSAILFQLQFVIDLGGSSDDYGLFLDCFHHTNEGSSDPVATHAGSEFTTGGTPETAKGFRMAFYSAVATNYKNTVFADLQTSGTYDHDGNNETAVEQGCSYVANNTDPFGTETLYAAADHDLIDMAYKTALPDEGVAAATAEARVDYLGKFAASAKDANNKVTLTYTVVCWFEGTDPEIVNRNAVSEYQSVAATLKFEAIRLG